VVEAAFQLGMRPMKERFNVTEIPNGEFEVVWMRLFTV